MNSKADNSKGKGTGRLVKVDGTEHRFNGDFKALQEAVGGMVQYLAKLGGHAIAVNEDGRSLGLKVNKSVTALVGTTIFGDVVIFENGQFAKCK